MRRRPRKSLEGLLREANIEFEKTDGGYYLWGHRTFVYSEKACYKILRQLKNRGSKRREIAKKIQNKRIRQFPLDSENRPVHKPDRLMWD